MYVCVCSDNLCMLCAGRCCIFPVKACMHVGVSVIVILCVKRVSRLENIMRICAYECLVHTSHLCIHAYIHTLGVYVHMND
jgi:hypothetical protein